MEFEAEVWVKHADKGPDAVAWVRGKVTHKDDKTAPVPLMCRSFETSCCSCAAPPIQAAAPVPLVCRCGGPSDTSCSSDTQAAAPVPRSCVPLLHTRQAAAPVPLACAAPPQDRLLLFLCWSCAALLQYRLLLLYCSFKTGCCSCAAPVPLLRYTIHRFCCCSCAAHMPVLRYMYMCRLPLQYRLLLRYTQAAAPVPRSPVCRSSTRQTAAPVPVPLACAAPPQDRLLLLLCCSCAAPPTTLPIQAAAPVLFLQDRLLLLCRSCAATPIHRFCCCSCAAHPVRGAPPQYRLLLLCRSCAAPPIQTAAPYCISCGPNYA
jgi:hypothetical protein